MIFERSTVPKSKIHRITNGSLACGAKKGKRVKVASDIYALVGLTERAEDLRCKTCFSEPHLYYAPDDHADCGTV